MVKIGIDVSRYQGMIDWQRAKDQIDFAILRCGYGGDLLGQDDPTFKRNADECTRLKIPFGVYLYSYAQNEQDALSEANHVMRLIADYQMAYPIYLDLEDPSQANLENEQFEVIGAAFASELVRNRYFPGFYASYNWWTTKLTGAFFANYTRWIARYASVLGIDGFDMWQFTDNGSVAGIETAVDVNEAYRDFPSEIMAGGWNNFASAESYQIGDQVSFRYIFSSSDSTTPLIPWTSQGVITRIVNGARNPYLIGEGIGWVNQEVIIGKERHLANPVS